MFLAAGAMAIGVRVCEFAVMGGCFQPSDSASIFLGGLAVIWVGIETIIKHVKQ